MSSFRWTTLFSLFFILMLAAISPAQEEDRLFTIDHWSEALQKTTSFHVLMPEEADPETNYPVLYLLHGAYGDYTDWPKRTDIEEHTKGYEMIVVMPDGGQFGWYVDSPVEATSEYETYISQELIDTVDELLPTIPKREGRGIAGLSMGGHGAITLAAKHPDLYSSASSLSGILDIAAHTDRWHLIDRLGEYEDNPEAWTGSSAVHLAGNFVDADVALLFDSGREDETGAFEDSQAFHEKLKELGVEHTWIPREGTHSWQYWDEHIPEHMAFHAGNFAKRLGRLVSPEQKQEREEMPKFVRRYYDRVDLFRSENEILKKHFPNQKTVVLLGSSSVEIFFRQEGDLVPGWFALDRGISADTIGLGERGILNRLDSSVFDCNPAHVFILNGRNDLGGTVREGTPQVEEVVGCYRKVVETILDRLPEVQVHIVSCFPTRGRYEKMAPLVPRYNAGIQAIAEDLDRVVFLDVFSELVGEDGLLLPEYSGDGLHVKGEAYRIWAGMMEESLCENSEKL